MFVQIFEPPGYDPELIGQLVRTIRRAVARQRPQDSLFTIQVVKLGSQTVFPAQEPESEENVRPSHIVTVVCWQAGGFFRNEPDDDVSAQAAARDEVVGAFRNFQIAMWFARMDRFGIALPRPQ